MSDPQLSVVVPVYNEEAGLPALFARLFPALDALRVPYEVIFVNDGSRDRSAALLKDQYLARPDVTRVVLFNANYGQHTAIIAGFERVRGEDVRAGGADAVDVGVGHGGVQRQRHGRIRDAFGVRQVAAMIAEPPAQRGQVQRLVRHAGCDALRRQRVAKGFAGERELGERE